MASLLSKIFRRKKQAPLVCSVSLDDSGNPISDDPGHKHTSACFTDFEPLAVVELFQSQSCQACPPAIPGILEGASKPNLLLLTYNVTIFDHLGWKDTYASNASDQRQRAYVRNWQRTSIFTPHVVVNGVADGSGANGKGEVEEIIQRARTAQGAMGWHIYADANDTEVRIDSDLEEALKHDILLVVYQSEDEKVKIGKGPNKGKKIVHRNAVKNVTKIGEWVGGNLTIPLQAQMRSHEEAAILVQQGGNGGPIVAASKV